MIHPRRPKLGQHFLADPKFRRLIADSLDVQSDELLIEIGPGRGALTALLAARGGHVVAVELDGALASKLRKEFAAEPRVEVLHADILDTDIAVLCRERGAPGCAVFGNLPYYITSPILHHLFGYAASIRAMALVMQHEVALRVTADPGAKSGRDYGYLSVLAQLYSKPRLRFVIPPGAFVPPPKVQSALVTFEMAPRFADWNANESGAFLQFVQRCFAQKRKNLGNNLAGVYTRARVARGLDSLGLAPNLRAEQVTLERFRDLYRILHKPESSVVYKARPKTP
ncbi:MAG TPA: 16S rRNA (adenine(1518)-N(6)/adenine(1519)-N(6))-dimethyltransferase RsmA [Terriglobia bacterium]|nr:16S rRNA (adenine(1518)-N(6)/adenine(1519)-N(6))-dimethyltransferase RsmA [Terriglobia bacterium]